MSRCVIVGGAEIKNYPFVKKHLSDADFYIYCDSGLNHRQRLGKEPNLIVGDFDSTENPNLPTETIVLPREKDWTDTLYGVLTGIDRGFEEFVLVGVLGNRMDHSLGNLYILQTLAEKNKKGIIIDDYSQITLITDETVYIDDNCEYFSLLAINGTAKGVNIKNAKYEVTDGEITPGFQYGVSNEPVKGKTAQVSVKSGSLLLVKVY